VAALNLVRLEWMIGGENVGGVPSPRGKPTAPGEGTLPTEMTYAQRAELLIEAFRPQWSRTPQALPQMLVALEMLLAEPRTVVLAGDPATAEFQALAAVLPERLGRARVWLCADGGAGQRWLAGRRAYLAEIKPGPGGATAYVCENFTCSAPAHSPAALRDRLGSA
jgi:uncharacterized protein YyaL (SSP411 family)